MGQITIRIDEELEKKIEESRGDKPKSDFYRDILSAFVSKSDGNLTTTDDSLITQNADRIQVLEQQISSLKDQNADLRDDKIKLMTLLNQEQALHMRTQKMLPGPVPEQKTWWKFWK